MLKEARGDDYQADNEALGSTLKMTNLIQNDQIEEEFKKEDKVHEIAYAEGGFEMREEQVMNSQGERVKVKFIIHKVQPLTDNLLGISLKYSVSIFKIKELNDCIGNEIAHLSELKLPCTE